MKIILFLWTLVQMGSINQKVKAFRNALCPCKSIWTKTRSIVKANSTWSLSPLDLDDFHVKYLEFHLNISFYSFSYDHRLAKVNLCKFTGAVEGFSQFRVPDSPTHLPLDALKDIRSSSQLWCSVFFQLLVTWG